MRKFKSFPDVSCHYTDISLVELFCVTMKNYHVTLAHIKFGAVSNAIPRLFHT